MNIDLIDSLLCDCLGQASDSDLIAKLNSLSLKEWEVLWKHARNQHVPSLLFSRVKALQPTQPFPERILKEMRSVAINEAAIRIQQRYSISKLLEAFRSNGIPVIVLKGAYLGEVIYRDFSLRSMVDIDLLVLKVDLDPTIEMLRDLGYSMKYVGMDPWNGSDNMELPPFVKPDSLTVDIHWTLERPTTPYNIDVADLWNRAKETTVAGEKVKVLAPEDLFLHLCLHNAFHHQFAMGLRNLCDIREFLVYFNNALDWQQVLEQAQKWNVVRCIYLNLYLAQELLGANIPSNILEQTKPTDFDPKIEETILERLFNPKIHSEFMLPPLARVWRSNRIKDILAVLIKYGFPTPDTMAGIYSIELNTLRIYFYYPVRWMYLVRRWGPFIWRLTFHEKKAVALFAIMKKDVAKNDSITDWLASSNQIVRESK
jgi:hypothetical protein